MSSKGVLEATDNLSHLVRSVIPELKLLRRRFDDLGFVRQVAHLDRAAGETLSVYLAHRLESGEPVEEIAKSFDGVFDNESIESLAGALPRHSVSGPWPSLIATNFVGMPERARQSTAGLFQFAGQHPVVGLFDIDQLPDNLPMASDCLWPFLKQLEMSMYQAIYIARQNYRSWDEIAQEVGRTPHELSAHCAERCHEEAIFDFDEFSLSDHPDVADDRLNTFRRLDALVIARSKPELRDHVRAELASEQKLDVETRLGRHRNRLSIRARESGRFSYNFPADLLGFEAEDADPIAQPRLGEGVSAPMSSLRDLGPGTLAVYLE